MRKLRMFAASLMFIGLAVVSQQAVAQDKTADKGKAKEKATKIDKFAAGKTLSKDDVGFLTMVTETKVDKSRGAGAQNVTMGGKTYNAGTKLTAEDATAINAKVAEYSKNHKDNVSKDEKNKSRGGDTCYYYCYYDAYGNYICYWYCY